MSSTLRPNFMDAAQRFLATLGGLGDRVPGPGTAASLLTVLLLIGIGGAHTALTLGLIALAIGSGISLNAQRLWGIKDPGVFVLDEVAGMALTLAGLPLTWPWVLGGFILFRLFDIWKPLGIRKLDRWGHPLSIMADDLLAALYAHLLLRPFL